MQFPQRNDPVNVGQFFPAILEFHFAPQLNFNVPVQPFPQAEFADCLSYVYSEIFDHFHHVRGDFAGLAISQVNCPYDSIFILEWNSGNSVKAGVRTGGGISMTLPVRQP